MITDNTVLNTTACFRITAADNDRFKELLRTIPGSEAGSMYRAIFSRGLKAIIEEVATLKINKV